MSFHLCLFQVGTSQDIELVRVENPSFVKLVASIQEADSDDTFLHLATLRTPEGVSTRPKNDGLNVIEKRLWELKW